MKQLRLTPHCTSGILSTEGAGEIHLVTGLEDARPVFAVSGQIQAAAIHPKPGMIKASVQDRPAFILILILCITALFINSARSEYDEKYRPQYHFSPKRGWIGDPDGLIFFKNEYHLFWWGHAVSKDLVHWKEMPYPMQGGRGNFHYFTGSVVVDKNNTAGFGKDSLVAIYTMHDSATSKEAQGISHSEDGIKFHFYNQNPVLDLHNDDFRDPHVFWFEPSKQWVMAITEPKEHKVSFYASDNLKKWNYLSDFGPDGDASHVWEVPDLFELPLNGDSNKKKWVLTVGVGPNRVQYFVGKFNGREFIKDKAERGTLWADYGADFYAETGILFVDRTNCSDHYFDQTFNRSFPERMQAPLRIKSGQIKLNILVDESSVEVFANDGEVTLSTTTFPDPKQTGISFFAKGGATIKKFEAWELAAIWNK